MLLLTWAWLTCPWICGAKTDETGEESNCSHAECELHWANLLCLSVCDDSLCMQRQHCSMLGGYGKYGTMTKAAVEWIQSGTVWIYSRMEWICFASEWKHSGISGNENYHKIRIFSESKNLKYIFFKFQLFCCDSSPINGRLFMTFCKAPSII